MPGSCIPNVLPIEYGISVAWNRDLRCMPKEMLHLMEGGGLPTVEELLWEDKEEEEQGEQPPMAGMAGLS